jgi:NADH-quinone oxidoreductase subunit J
MGLFVYGFSGLAIACAIMVVTRRNPIASALYLCLALFSLAALFVLLEAYFIAAVQVLVYAGAVMVLFVFVIMLLNLDPEKMNLETFHPPKLLAIVSTSVLFGFFAFMFWTNKVTGDKGFDLPISISNSGGHLHAISSKLFTSFLLAFEATSLLLLVAMVGAVVLAKRKV